MKRYGNGGPRIEMCEKVALKGMGNCGLKFLYTLVKSTSFPAIHLCKGSDVQFGFDNGIVVVSLTSTGRKLVCRIITEQAVS